MPRNGVTLLVAGLVDVSAAFVTAIGGLRASRLTFRMLMGHLFCAPMSFYDITPIGRLLNIISSDLTTVDYVMPFSLRSVFNCMLGLGACLVVI
jgi:ABC-type multidrug transport system fused ATPase/permease subunit